MREQPVTVGVQARGRLGILGTVVRDEDIQALLSLLAGLVPTGNLVRGLYIEDLASAW